MSQSSCLIFSLSQMRRRSRRESKSRSTRRMNRLSSISWDSEWLQASRRSSPAKNSGYQMIVLFVNFSVVGLVSKRTGRRLCQSVVLVLGFGFYSCLFLFICLFLNALMWSSTTLILMQIEEFSTQILKFSLYFMKSIHI